MKEALNDLLISYADGILTDTNLLKIINETVHYNSSFQPYLFEMLFIQALDLDKIPKSPMIISMLFKNCGTEDYLYPETYGQEGTRVKVLKRLGLNKTLEIYELFLIKENPESHTKFDRGVKDPKYIQGRKSNITFEIIRDSIQQELND